MTPHIRITFSYRLPSLQDRVKDSALVEAGTGWETFKASLPPAFYPELQFESYSWDAHADGGYPLFYITKDHGILSPQAANEHVERTLDPDDEQFYIVAMDINYEDNFLFCDHTGKQIYPAYEG